LNFNFNCSLNGFNPPGLEELLINFHFPTRRSFLKRSGYRTIGGYGNLPYVRMVM